MSLSNDLHARDPNYNENQRINTPLRCLRGQNEHLCAGSVVKHLFLLKESHESDWANTTFKLVAKKIDILSLALSNLIGKYTDYLDENPAPLKSVSHKSHEDLTEEENVFFAIYGQTNAIKAFLPILYQPLKVLTLPNINRPLELLQPLVPQKNGCSRSNSSSSMRRNKSLPADLDTENHSNLPTNISREFLIERLKHLNENHLETLAHYEDFIENRTFSFVTDISENIEMQIEKWIVECRRQMLNPITHPFLKKTLVGRIDRLKIIRQDFTEFQNLLKETRKELTLSGVAL